MKTIIMAGGSGARLWPLSRSKYPKQFLKLKGFPMSFFQMTIKRCLLFCHLEDIYVVTNKEYEFIISTQIEELKLPSGKLKILLEPMAKNTLPAIYNAVREIRRSGDDTVVVLPSDHLIREDEKFAQAVSAVVSDGENFIYTFGVKPNFPETGFGYINPGASLSIGNKVKEFKEKPDITTASDYIERGYLWNAGIFVFNTELFYEEVQRYAPEVAQAFMTDDIDRAFKQSPGISIDYGLLEKSDRVAVMPISIQWDDIGSFASFYEHYRNEKDSQGNINFNQSIVENSTGNLIYTKKDKITALIGVKDLIVVDQEDALLICHKDSAQNVKNIVDELKRRGDSRSDLHLTEYRPWGSFNVLEQGEFYKIKRLTILPGKKISDQMHHHRTEHWIVVQGTAEVTINGQNHLVRSGESIFVNIGDRHRLSNNGKMMLEVIEVQSGHYLGEDDIIRFHDDFNRK